MKKTLLFFSLLCAITISLHAQSARDLIRKNHNLAASNYYAYPGPQKALTPTPNGYVPFYISHYGRHGSRFISEQSVYDHCYNVLSKADSLGKLTPAGKDALKKVALIRDEAYNRWGELSLLGAQQHRQIAHRMYERFPEVFSDDCKIDAKATIIIRCILSMSNALQELVKNNPKLAIREDASLHDMYYMNNEQSKYETLKKTEEAKKALDDFYARHNDRSHLMKVLFNDKSYADNIDAVKFGYDLLTLASNIQSTELRKQISLWDIFTEDEIFNYWLENNANWYTYFAASSLTGKAGLYAQVNLMKNIVATADSCIKLKHPSATLRFGHEVDVLPLACLLNLNNCGRTIDKLDDLDKEGWHNFNIYPMGCNIQMIFYKPLKKDYTDNDILVKVLLNEDEATMPLKSSNPPYYSWKDVKDYCLKQIENK